MRVLIQWAKATPSSWEEHAIVRRRDWRQLPRKAAPTSDDQPVDDQPGWINAINVQGVVLRGYDVYAVAPDGDALVVASWQDSDHFPPGARWATVWRFLSPAPDPALGGLVNTRQTRTVYAEDGAGIPSSMNVLPWGDFRPPPTPDHRFGKWLPGGLFVDHLQALIPRGWREWVE